MQGTVLMHPEIAEKVDSVEWEVDLQRRAVKDGFMQQAFLLILSVIWGVLGVFQYGIFVLPLLWYYGKNRLIKSSAREINKQFKAEYYDVEQLLREIPVLTKDRQEKEQKASELRLLKRQEDAYKKKFGIQ